MDHQGRRLETAAEMWRLMLRQGLAQVEDIRGWADARIAEMDVPDEWLIELSTLHSKADMNRELQNVPGESDMIEAWPGPMKAWLAQLDKDPERDLEIARTLKFLSDDGEEPCPEASSEMSVFWTDIYLAIDGVMGHRDTERERLQCFLAKWSSTPE